MLSTAWQFNHYPHTLRSPSKTGRVKYCIINGAIRGTATTSLLKTKPITVKLLKPLFQHDKRKRIHTTGQKTQLDVAAMIVEVVQKEREKLRAEITLQVTNAIANSIPP
nr:hypothetical protein [Tanacetum cinerariifolium]